MTFEAITDVRKEEQQRQAVDTVLKNIYEMISASVGTILNGFRPIIH